VSLTDNNGTQYYGISCGVPSSPGVDITSNSGSRYYWLSCNDYILYGQPAFYPHQNTNNSRFEHLYQCGVASDAGLNLQANNGTKYFYSSSFNCVGFCSTTTIPMESIQDYLGDGMYFVYENWKLGNAGDMSLGANGQLLNWTGSVSGKVCGTRSTHSLANRSIVYNNSYIEINGLTQSISSRWLALSTPSDFSGNQPRARKTFWVIDTNFHAGSGSNTQTNIVLGGFSSGTERDGMVYVKSTSAFNVYDNLAFVEGTSLSSYALTGYNTYIVETGTADNGGTAKLNNVLMANTGGFWARDLWSMGGLDYGATANTANTLNMRLREIVFLKHPNSSSAVPTSASNMTRAYLFNKYSIRALSSYN